MDVPRERVIARAIEPFNGGPRGPWLRMILEYSIQIMITLTAMMVLISPYYKEYLTLLIISLIGYCTYACWHEEVREERVEPAEPNIILPRRPENPDIE